MTRVLRASSIRAVIICSPLVNTNAAVKNSAALDWLRNNPAPALILLDLMMAEVDGFEFLEQMRQNTEWLDIPVVVLTAKSLTDEERIFLAERTMLILSKSAQPIGSLGRALAAIAERGPVAVRAAPE